MLILVDCGTTNMRLRLYCGEQGGETSALPAPIAEVKYQMGVRDAAREGSSEALKETLSAGIREILSRASMSEADIEAVICSGTLSSHIGIYHIHHVCMPATLQDTAEHSQLVRMPEICNIPILFIPGVKGVGDLMYTEVMSGEECELYGIAERWGLHSSYALMLPGSYNKIISVDEHGAIVKILSSISGELIAAVSENTLLRKSVPHPVIRTIIPEMLHDGAEFARKYGLSPAMSKVWVMRRVGKNTDEAANFLVGAILEGDVRLMSEIPSDFPVYVGGSSPLRELYLEILDFYGIKATGVSPEIARIAPNIGAMKVYSEYKKKQSER